MTEREKEVFQQHLSSAIEHMNTLVVWVFISLVAMICVNGEIDTPFDGLMSFAAMVSGGMAGLNSMWGWRSLRAAHAIIKRNRS